MIDWFPPLFDGTLREHYLLLFGMAGGIAMVVGGVAAWVGAWWGGRRAIRRGLEHLDPGATRRLELQIEQLAQSVDLIALEVERVAEAQRFSARLLVERQTPPTAPAPRREAGPITPH